LLEARPFLVAPAPPDEEENDSAKNATAVDSIVGLQNGTSQRINRGRSGGFGADDYHRMIPLERLCSTLSRKLIGGDSASNGSKDSSNGPTQ
jgi:hypothetical protein